MPNSIMKRFGNLFPQIVSMDNLLLAERRARAAKGWMSAVQHFENNLESNLKAIQTSLINHTFTTSPYRTKFAYYPKFREIFIVPFAPDRIVQHALMAILEPIWDARLIDNTVSCRKNRGIDYAFKLAARFANTRAYCLKCDISKFYPSIDHDILFELITRKIKCSDTLWLLQDIVYSYGRQFNTKTNSPIGNYTSQWFGNIYLDIVDRYATVIAKVDYIRYCDDFIFFSDDKEQLKDIAEFLPTLLMSERHLKLSKCQLLNLKKGLDFVGYRFFPEGYILLRKRTAKVLKRRFRRLRRRIDNGANTTHRKIRGKIASAIGLLSRCNAFHLKKSTGFFKLVRDVKIRPRKKRIHYYVNN